MLRDDLLLKWPVDVCNVRMPLVCQKGSTIHSVILYQHSNKIYIPFTLVTVMVLLALPRSMT